ncbi:MAG: hypothetical protein HOV83_04415 [Catenulispora sp.]|nr:hypothetical protein [Catenulispora sp.]
MRKGLAQIALAVVAALAATAVIIALVVGTPVISFVMTYGCHGAEVDLAKSMKAHPIFTTYPPGATPQNAWYSSCDDDDRVVEVSHEYRLPDGEVDVLGFYRDLALRDGWTLSPEAGDNFCYTKDVAGNSTDLTVWLADETFSVGLSSSIEGGGWC